MDEVDKMQQRQLDSQGWLVKFLLIINTAAAVAQVVECVKIWTTLK